PRSARRAGGVLTVGGLDVRDLAAEFGTPLFICDEDDFRQRCRGYREAFGPQAGVFYAAKAFCCRGVLRWVTEEGLGVDVCTGGELEVALQAGVPPEMITLHGSNKLESELARALDAGVGHIVVDSFEEIARLAFLTDPPVPGRGARRAAGAGADGNADENGTGRRGAGHRPRVLVRITTGVEAHTHEFVATAHDDQKFGFSLSSGAADEAVRRVLACPGVELAGLHSHIGSQIFDTDGFEAAARRVLGLAVRIRDEHGIVISELNLGGGLGIAYTADDDPADVKVIAQNLHEIVRGQCAAAGLAMPRLTVEPGRAIAGPGTVTLYEVGTVKDVDGLRTYVSVDGGMSDNIRTALYDAEYTCVLASRESAAPPMLSRIVGRHCESGDIVVRDSYLPADLVPGDLLAVAATGAYCRSMASNYNHVARPAVVAVREGAARLLLRRETIEDLLRLDAG
ncbi:MAG: diaminopimelate decarboxylase, partial [Streptosporangiaceae bacterium]